MLKENGAGDGRPLISAKALTPNHIKRKMDTVLQSVFSYDNCNILNPREKCSMFTVNISHQNKVRMILL